MKPHQGDQQLRPVSLSYSVALQALKPNPLSKKKGRRGLDASTDRGLTERSGEVFSLDILSHRMQAPIEVSRREGEVFLLDILSHRMQAPIEVSRREGEVF